ncbi:MAG: sulfite exporter TauE/SafE family protein [Deltaproteobacteria bacterium]|nr:sulfite exporter TauE/SafE family protein [Deltaproteobacteria bacterium]
MHLIYIIIGLFAGFLSGLLGIGGGIVMVPALMILAGMTPHQSIQVSLFAIIPAAISGTLKHASYSHPHLMAVIFLALGAIIGAYFGAASAQALPADTLRRIFGVFLLVTGSYLLLRH